MKFLRVHIQRWRVTFCKFYHLASRFAKHWSMNIFLGWREYWSKKRRVWQWRPKSISLPTSTTIVGSVKVRIGEGSIRDYVVSKTSNIRAHDYLHALIVLMFCMVGLLYSLASIHTSFNLIHTLLIMHLEVMFLPYNLFWTSPLHGDKHSSRTC